MYGAVLELCFFVAYSDRCVFFAFRLVVRSHFLICTVCSHVSQDPAPVPATWAADSVIQKPVCAACACSRLCAVVCANAAGARFRPRHELRLEDLLGSVYERSRD